MTSSHLLSWRETDNGPPVAKRHRSSRVHREEDDSNNNNHNNNSNQENDDAESRYPQMTVSDTSGSPPSTALASDQQTTSSQPPLCDQVFNVGARSSSLSPPPTITASSLSHLPVVISPLLATTIATTDFMYDSSSSSRSSVSPHLTDPDTSQDANQRECFSNQVDVCCELFIKRRRILHV